MTTRGSKIDLLIVRLGAEGVPVAAIARAAMMDIATVVDILRIAHEDGRLSAMPGVDWTEGRLVPAIPSVPLGEVLPLASLAQWALGLTRAESIFLAALMVFGKVDTPTLLALVRTSERTSPDVLKVYASRVRRKVRRCKVGIEVLWGTGYAIAPAARDRILAFIEQKSGARHAA
jgi:hypothetical protein